MQGIVMERRGGIGARALLWAGFGPLLGTLAVLVGFVLWPTENVFLHPNHWFECMLQCGVCWMGELHYNPLKNQLINQIFKNYSISSPLLPVPSGKHCSLARGTTAAESPRLPCLLPNRVHHHDGLLGAALPGVDPTARLALPSTSTWSSGLCTLR